MAEVHDECGVGAVFVKDKAKEKDKALYYLYKLLLNMQNRGQLSTGFTSFNKNNAQLLMRYRHVGSVNQLFKTHNQQKSKSIFEKYFVPKYLLVKDIMSGLERKELNELWNDVPLGTLKGRVKKYFGTLDLYKIKLVLVTPYIDKCLKRGYTQKEALNYLIECGFNMFSDEFFQDRIEKYGQEKIRRTAPKLLFKRMLIDLQRDFYHLPVLP